MPARLRKFYWSNWILGLLFIIAGIVFTKWLGLVGFVLGAINLVVFNMLFNDKTKIVPLKYFFSVATQIVIATIVPLFQFFK